MIILGRSREQKPQSSCSTENYWVPRLEDIESNGQSDDRVEGTNEQDSREIGQYLPCNDFVYDTKIDPITPLQTAAVLQTFHMSQLQNSTLGLVHSLNVSQSVH